ncbi:MAG: beta-xylosidase, partial [Clostridiales bacterium]|nr:beta-xylosidase [Clostridiales bacterium]
MKKRLFALALTLLILCAAPFSALAVETTGSITASYSGSTVTFSGSVSSDEKAVAVLLLDLGGSQIAMNTCAVTNEGTFSGSMSIRFTRYGTYTVKAADYDGGPFFAEADFTVTAPPYGGDGTPETSGYNAEVSGGSSLSINLDTEANKVTVDLETITGSLFGGETTVVTLPSIPGVSTYTVSLPAAALSGSSTGALTVKTDTGSITVPGNMLSGTGLTGSAEIAIGTGDKEKLPDAVKAAIGDKPLIKLTLSIDGARTGWSNPDAPVTVSIPYTPTAEELANPESIVIWYIDGGGNVVTIPNSRYDAMTGTVSFSTTHFSDYAVAYNPVSYNDVVSDVWYSKPVGFIAARKIAEGTGGGYFSPEARLTRGEFIVMMMRAYGLAPDENPPDNFSDAGSTYYTGYLAAA